MKRIITLCLLGIIVLSCGRNANPVSETILPGLASPISLQSQETVLDLNDYILYPHWPDMIQGDGLECMADTQKRTVTLRLSPNSEKIAYRTLTLNFGKQQADILVATNTAEEVVLSIPDQGYKTVQIKGEFNAWNPSAILPNKENQQWVFRFHAKAGQYQYCMIIDGKEGPDPNNPVKVNNGMDGTNSVLKVGNTTHSDTPLMISSVKASNRIEISANKDCQYIVFWNNTRLDDSFLQVNPQTQNLVISIPKNARKISRSFVRVYAFNGMERSNDILIPIEKGQIITQSSDLVREDFHRQILYSLMIDRFNNGQKNNDHPLNSPEVHPKADYMGGDLVGITQKITEGFFEAIGVNTIWISPITQNPLDAWGQYLNPKTKFSGYHGYWPLYMTVVDFRFGTDAELRDLLSTAHAHNLNVILDYAANHVHINSPFYKEHPDWCTPMYLPDGTRNLERWDDHRLTTWFDTHLPKFDFEKETVSNVLSDSLLYWVEKFDFDGFRHDASKHIHERFWKMSTKKMKQRIQRPLYQIGETYGSPELIASYVNSGMLNAQFDFNVYDAVVTALLNGSFKDVNASLLQSLNTYGYHNLMGNITGNHDRARFISYAGGAVKTSEDTKLAGWTREIGVGDPKAYDKLKLLHAFIMTIPGIPCVYQGDEFGQPGGNDPDNRRMMQFENFSEYEKNTLDNLSNLTKKRTSSMALLYGDYFPIHVDDDLLIFIRKYFNQIALVAINKSLDQKSIELTIPEFINSNDLPKKIHLEPLSYLIDLH